MARETRRYARKCFDCAWGGSNTQEMTGESTETNGQSRGGDLLTDAALWRTAGSSMNPLRRFWLRQNEPAAGCGWDRLAEEGCRVVSDAGDRVLRERMLREL
jgi:hypothetical protein